MGGKRTDAIAAEHKAPRMRRGSTSRADRVGIRHCDLVVEEQLNWLFREQPTHDYGIDAHAEVVQDDESVSGRLIGMQIKSGDSYFKTSKVGDGWTFRSDNKHLSYWLGHSLPTIVVLVSSKKEAFWQVISTATVSETGESFTVLVPRNQPFDASAREPLERLAARPGNVIAQFPQNIAALPPGVAELLRIAEESDQLGACRLADHLARGAGSPALAAASIVGAAPSWLAASRAARTLWRAAAVYAAEHNCFKAAGAAFAAAGAVEGDGAGRCLAEAGVALTSVNRRQARTNLTAARRLGETLLPDLGMSLLTVPKGDGRAAPIPDSIAHASAEELNREPVILLFLAEMANRAGRLDEAVRYAERAVAVASWRDTKARLALARLIHRRAALSDMSHRDFRRALALATEVVEERRRWNGPSAEALELVLDLHINFGDMTAAVKAALPPSEGGKAQDGECRSSEVAWRGAYAARAIGSEPARRFFERYTDAPHRLELKAMELEAAGAPRSERLEAYNAVLRSKPDDPLLARTIALLVRAGIWAPEADDLLTRGVVPQSAYDLLKAEYLARTGDKAIGLAHLRQLARHSAHAAAELVRIIEDVDGADAAIAEAELLRTRWSTSTIPLRLLDLYVKNGHEDRAAELIEQYIGDDAFATEIRLQLANWYVARKGNQGNYGEATSMARRGLAIDDDTDLAWSLVKALHNSGHAAEARTAFSRHKPEPVTDDETRLWFHLHLGVGLDAHDAATLIGIIRRLPDGLQRDAAIGTLAREVLFTPHTPALYSREVEEAATELFDHASTRAGGTLSVNADDQDALRAALEEGRPDPVEFEQLLARLRRGEVSQAELARHANLPYAAVLLRAPAGIVPAYDLAAGIRRAGEAAARVALDTGACVADLSALRALGLLDEETRLQIQGLLPRLVAARSSVGDATFAREQMRGLSAATHIYYLTLDGTIEITQLSPLQQAVEREHAEALEESVSGLEVHAADPRVDPEADSIALAIGFGLVLWCDDMAMRQKARLLGRRAFSTLDLLTVLKACDGATQLDSCLLNLAKHRFVDLPLDASGIVVLAETSAWQPGPAHNLLARPGWWQHQGNSWPEAWTEISEAAAGHSEDAFVHIVEAAMAGAIAAVTTGLATQRLQQLLVRSFVGFYESGKLPASNLMPRLAQHINPSFIPNTRFVLHDIVDLLRSLDADDPAGTAQSLLPGTGF